MRIERIEASKHKRGRVLVFLDDGACLKITEQELLDFGLRAGDELDEEALKRLKGAAGVSNVKGHGAVVLNTFILLPLFVASVLPTDKNLPVEISNR